MMATEMQAAISPYSIARVCTCWEQSHDPRHSWRTGIFGGPIRKMTGRGGKTIRVFEFRITMPNGGGVTRVGRTLRILSLDVLPRIVNVLYGDLSFVGPKVSVEKQVDEQLSELRPGIVSPEAFASDDPWGELKTSFGAGYWFRTIGKTISFSIKPMRRPPR